MNDNDIDGENDSYFDIDLLLPRDISDEAAAVLSEFLTELTIIVDTRYATHYLRYMRWCESQSPPVALKHARKYRDID